MKQILIIVFAISFQTGCIGYGDISDITSKKDVHFPSMTGIDLMGELQDILKTLKQF